MWVQALEHAANGVLHKLILVDSVDIQAVDDSLGELQFPQGRVLVEAERYLGRRGQRERCEEEKEQEKPLVINVMPKNI